MPVLTGVLGALVVPRVHLACSGSGSRPRCARPQAASPLSQALIFVLPIGLQFLSMTGWEWVPAVSGYLPMSLGGTLGMGDIAMSTDPTYWGAMLSIALWAAVPARARAARAAEPRREVAPLALALALAREATEALVSPRPR